MRLSVDGATGRVRLTLPPRAGTAAALRWAETQRDWIAAQHARLPQPQPFIPGATIPCGDAELTIGWNPALPRRVERIGDTLRCGGTRDGVARRIETWLRREALIVLTTETRAMAQAAGVIVDGVAVGDPRRRWGSCTATGAIRYSWRLILAPPFVRQATVAHEVAHRFHMNHGPAFHAACTALGGDPAPARAWLRTHGAGLHWIGRNAEESG